MIGWLRGEVAVKRERGVILDVAGVGYLVAITTGSLAKIKVGQALTLHTHLAARENAMELFGFENGDELKYFSLLLSVPGVGPKSALAIMSLASPEILEKAIAREDKEYLTRVAGIGRKSAEKIILALKDKVGSLGEETGGINLDIEIETLEALRSLGYSSTEARTALKQVVSEIDVTEETTINSTTLIKLALKNLSQNNHQK